MKLESWLTGLDRVLDHRTSPPVAAETEFGRLLWRTPAPLIHPRAKLIVIYSAKSACTPLLIWFLHQLGHRQAARDYHIWPHDYRDHFYYYSTLYREAYSLDLTGFHVLRVMRDPFARAVSSFRHMLGDRFRHDGLMSRLRYRNIERDGLSFECFLDHLENVDLATCNPHYSIQRHPIEDVLPVHYLIDVGRESLITRLHEVEIALGLPHIDLAGDPWLKELAWHQRPADTFGQGEDMYRYALTPRQARGSPWPHYASFLNEESHARIRRLYAVDFDSYVKEATPGPAGPSKTASD